MIATRLSARLRAAVAGIGLAGVAGLLLASTAAQAVTISPVVVELAPAHRVVSITLSNSGDQPLRYQSKTVAWHLVDGLDQYDDTDDLIVAPAIFEIRAGASQIVRVTLRHPATGGEQAYRLIFQDITAITAPATTDEVAINFHVDHNLPVFVSAPGKPQASLQAMPCPGVPGACLRLVNGGGRYAQVKSLALDQGAWHKELPVNARILAGAWRQWPLELPASTNTVRVSAQTGDGTVTAELPVAGR